MLKPNLAELRPLYSKFLHDAQSLWYDLADDERGTDPCIVNVVAWQVFADFLACLELPDEIVSPGPGDSLFIPNLTTAGIKWSLARAATLDALRRLQALNPEAARQAFLKTLIGSMGRGKA